MILQNDFRPLSIFKLLKTKLMRKLFTFFIIFNTYYSNAQCEFNFEELLKNSVVNSSEFDSFALKRGYTFDAESKTYFCTTDPNNPTKENSLRRFLDGNILNLNHSTRSKNSYLEIKNKMSSMGFKYNGTANLSNMTTYNYSANNINVTLATETRDMENNYLVIIKIELSE